MESLALFFQQQRVDDAGRQAIDFEKISFLLLIFRVYFVVVGILAMVSFDCFSALRFALDSYVFVFGCICLGLGFYGALYRKAKYVGMYIGLSIVWLFSSLLFLMAVIHLASNPYMLMYCIPDVDSVDENPAVVLEMLDLVMYLANFIVLCISLVWAMQLVVALGEAGEAPSAGYGYLGTGDDFSSLGQNHSFNDNDNCLLDDSDEGEVLVSDEEP